MDIHLQEPVVELEDWDIEIPDYEIQQTFCYAICVYMEACTLNFGFHFDESHLNGIIWNLRLMGKHVKSYS